jgi:hypothetical protein
MDLITERGIIELRDQMSIEDLRAITNKCMADWGFVSFRYLFITMGYVHAFNDKWIKPKKN